MMDIDTANKITRLDDKLRALDLIYESVHRNSYKTTPLCITKYVFGFGATSLEIDINTKDALELIAQRRETVKQEMRDLGVKI